MTVLLERIAAALVFAHNPTLAHAPARDPGRDTALAHDTGLAQDAQTAAQVPRPEDIEREVLENVVRQPLGPGTVDDLALPEDFLRRVADRAVRASYEERYRIVVPDGKKADPIGFRAAPSFLILAVGGLLLAAILWVVIARRGAATRG